MLLPSGTCHVCHQTRATANVVSNAPASVSRKGNLTQLNTLAMDCRSVEVGPKSIRCCVYLLHPRSVFGPRLCYFSSRALWRRTDASGG